jgi:pimeloyl-ACP methyl ester carboxylesterase
MKDSRITLPDGRTLAYTDIGEPGRPCVFFFHGAPSSRLRLGYLEHTFLSEGIRVISTDRPSYGGSSPQPGRSMAEWPADVAALADALDVDRFAVAGHSSGGPYALACAVAIPERVSAAITLGGVTDMAWPGAWEMGFAFETELMRLNDEKAIIARCVEVIGADGSRLMSAFEAPFPEPDARLYENEETAGLLGVSREEAFRQGVNGYAQDVFVQAKPCPFEPNSIAAPVQLLHGQDDTLLPMDHSRHNAELISTATLKVVPAHGHFSILAELPATASALARATA